MARWSFALLIAALFLGGCQSSSVSFYVSPRVTGRVVDAQTRQPIPGVTVKKPTPEPDARLNGPPKAAQVMSREAGVRTDRAGAFVLQSERDVALFQSLGWYSVTVSFERSGYQSLLTNYTSAHAVVSPQGEPVVNAGEIPLRPLDR